MPEPDPVNLSPLIGRFVVKMDGTTHTGLAAHEVAELLTDDMAESPEVYRIHRVDEAGRMELVGVAPLAFKQRDCLLFWRRRVEDARGDYDTLVEFAGRTPPPCRIEMCLGRAGGRSMPHVVALIFCMPCSESVGVWLGGVSSRIGDDVNGSTAALADYESAAPHVVRRLILEPPNL